ncbi:MAG: arylsulfatase [Alphaproteobacteria bacterium]|nr:MAG: arylsulfatase [Alphaproteobacteria bacterium]
MHFTEKVFYVVLSLIGIFPLPCFADAVSPTKAAQDSYLTQQPNILLIVADDLGLLDLGYMGSEIKTPNLDQLAQSGTILRNFYTAPTCSPTRSMLLSGTDHHIAGLGDMAETSSAGTKKHPGYEGYLNHQVTSLATRLQRNGYQTFMTGKWHLGYDQGQRPAHRGFDKSFALLNGAASHFAHGKMLIPGRPPQYLEDDRPISLPDNFYSTTSYTDKMLDYIDAATEQEKPFFAYLSYTAPHWPLQVPDNARDLYQGQYDGGYDRVRNHRISEAQKRGHLPQGVRPAPLPSDAAPWDKVPPLLQKRSARQMEIYAAMVDVMDQQIGRVIAGLAKNGQLDNTVIIFMSDNGPEGGPVTKYLKVEKWVDQAFDSSYDKIGTVASYDFYSRGWAAASAGLDRHYKGSTYQGGIHAPAFITLPGQQGRLKNVSSVTHVKDLYATILDLAHIELSVEQASRLQSRSLVPLLTQKNGTLEDSPQGWELRGNQAMRSGEWKLVKTQRGPWQLFNLARDPGETNDLSENEPEKLSQLLQDWQKYVVQNGILTPSND